MRVRPEQLTSILSKNLASCFWVTGDEPLQCIELAEQIRQTAKKAGYTQRDVLTVNAGFNWASLLQMAITPSLFAEQKIIELQMPSGKPGREGSAALIDYFERQPKDTLLLITSGKVASSALKSRWVQCIDATGVIIQVWPLEGEQLLSWVAKRLKSKGFDTQMDVVKLLALRAEGNLLALAQDIEKLYVMYEPGLLKREQVETWVVDNSRYDVFKLVDAMLLGKVLRSMKILNNLQHSGVAVQIVIWAIVKELRLLIELKLAGDHVNLRARVYREQRIWDKRKGLLEHTLQRIDMPFLEQAILLAGVADRQGKGLAMGDEWETILQLCLSFSEKEKINFKLLS